jgi:serine protease Do
MTIMKAPDIRLKRLPGMVLAGMFIFILAVGGPANASAPEGFSDTVKKLLPTVVTVATTQHVETQQTMPGIPEDSPLNEFFKNFGGQVPPHEREVSALGSGFIIDGEGHIVTNSHVISGAEEIKVITSDDSSYDAELIGNDPATDLALLKITAEAELPHAKWGDSDKVEIGDWTIAIGNPFGLGGSVTVGVLSARARNIQAGPYDNFLQTDAPINRGNSGGPLFNAEGEVIGVNTVILSPGGGNIGIGFAIPSDSARPIIAQLMKTGMVERGWLGVSIQPVNEAIAEAVGLDKAKGAMITDVFDGSPAQKAGIQSGDVILEFDGKKVGNAQELPRLVADVKTGTEVEIKLWRDNNTETVKATIGRRDEAEVARRSGKAPPKQQESAPAGAVLGMQLAPVTPEARDRLGLPEDVKGAVIVDMASDSAAADAGLLPGDVIEMVGSTMVSQPSDVAGAIAKAAKGDRQNVLLRVNRGGMMQYVAIPLKGSGTGRAG